MENNDVQFEKNDKVFNYRVAIIIRNENKILVQKDNRAKHLTLPGGRCELGEPSSDTACREFKEETGIDTIYVKSIGMIENFFVSSFNGKNYHEILMINELKFQNSNLYENTIINNIEDKKKEHISYTWKTLEELKNEDFRPSMILDILDQNEFIHLINKD